jgi:hypothetical protein
MSLKRLKSSKNNFMKLPRYSLKVALMILKYFNGMLFKPNGMINKSSPISNEGLNCVPILKVIIISSYLKNSWSINE